MNQPIPIPIAVAAPTREVWKYGPLHTGHNSIQLPKHARILSIGKQTTDAGREEIFLWALVDPAETTKWEHCFDLIVTGAPVPAQARFLGTLLLRNGNYVLHIFDRTGHQHAVLPEDRAPEHRPTTQARITPTAP